MSSDTPHHTTDHLTDQTSAPHGDPERTERTEHAGHAEHPTAGGDGHDRAEDTSTTMGEHTSAAAGRDERSALIAPDRAREYQQRWDTMKGRFVDEPRAAVKEADELVTQVLDELQQVFRQQRSRVESALGHDKASTEDLRQALGHYRGLLDRLLRF